MFVPVGLQCPRVRLELASVAIEYPDKLYIGTFEHSSRFDAHFDEQGISLTLERKGDPVTQKSIHLHMHYGLFGAILDELARTAMRRPLDEPHRRILSQAARMLDAALAQTADEQ